MAQIKIKALQEPIILSNRDAQEIKKLLKDKNTSKDHLIEVGELMCKKQDIVMIKEDSDIQEIWRKYDLYNPEQKQTILDFEKEYLEFCKNNPDKYFKDIETNTGTWIIGYKENWFQDLGAIRLNNDKVNNHTVLNPELFNDLEKRWSAFQELVWRREQAAKRDKEGDDALLELTIP